MNFKMCFCVLNDDILRCDLCYTVHQKGFVLQDSVCRQVIPLHQLSLWKSVVKVTQLGGDTNNSNGGGVTSLGGIRVSPNLGTAWSVRVHLAQYGSRYECVCLASQHCQYFFFFSFHTTLVFISWFPWILTVDSYDFGDNSAIKNLENDKNFWKILQWVMF